MQLQASAQTLAQSGDHKPLTTAALAVLLSWHDESVRYHMPISGCFKPAAVKTSITWPSVVIAFETSCLMARQPAPVSSGCWCFVC